MAEIIPAIMPQDFFDLQKKLERLANATSLVQIDVMDGKFVPARNWPYGKEDQNFAHILSQEEGMPFWDDLDFEVDLMVEKPEEKIEDWVVAGAKRFVVHYESVPDFEKFLEWYEKQYGPLDTLSLSPELGVAIGIETSIEKILPFLSRTHFIQLMGIAKIGYQGEPFDERVLEKISTLRKIAPDCTISVDGGVNFYTAPRLIDSGADRLVVGSAISESQNVIDTVREFERL